jgi:hypothetical protein
MKPVHLIVGVVLAAVVAGSFFLFGGKEPVVDNPLSAAAGPEVTEFTNFMTGLQRGGVVATSTDDTTATFLARDLNNTSRIDFTPNVAGITATLPATSTLGSFVQKTGDTRDMLLCNASTTAAATFTLAFGSGMIDSLATSTLVIGSRDCAQLTFSRAPNTDIDVFYDLGY